MLQINDIKPIVSIPDMSIYIYYTAIALLIVLVFLMLYLLYKFLKPKEKSKDIEYYKILQALDFSQTKQTSYDIARYGRLLAREERSILLIEDLCEKLTIYKYRKELKDEFSPEIKAQFSVFMESINVR